MRTGKVNLRAFSKDGYIINQQLLQSVPYGMKQSNNNGCGWIAAYNFLHGFDRKKSWDTVRQQMEDTLLFGGLLGTHVVQLYLYLRRHGFPRAGLGDKSGLACRPSNVQPEFCFITMVMHCILSHSFR